MHRPPMRFSAEIVWSEWSLFEESTMKRDPGEDYSPSNVP